MKDKIIFFAMLFACLPLCLQAQKVNKQVIAEHFTNSYCSACANRNPGFYENLRDNPEILHIAYFPSAPYPACPFNSYNKDENDARTNFYGVYGATPRVAIQGVALSGNSNYSDPAIFNMASNHVTSFAMRTALTLGGNMLNLRIVVTKVDTSYINSLRLYAAIAEDTVMVVSNNGEPLQQHVFRKSFVGAEPVAIAMPAAVGDSTVYNQNIILDQGLNISQIYAYGILSTEDMQIEQASRSARLTDIPMGTGSLSMPASYSVYPNPATDRLYLKGNISKITGITTLNIEGRQMETKGLGDGSFDIENLAPGHYLLKINTSDKTEVVRFYRH
jgi:hypothetical protein